MNISSIIIAPGIHRFAQGAGGNDLSTWRHCVPGLFFLAESLSKTFWWIWFWMHHQHKGEEWAFVMMQAKSKFILKAEICFLPGKMLSWDIFLIWAPFYYQLFAYGNWAKLKEMILFFTRAHHKIHLNQNILYIMIERSSILYARTREWSARWCDRPANIKRWCVLNLKLADFKLAIKSSLKCWPKISLPAKKCVWENNFTKSSHRPSVVTLFWPKFS